MFLSSSAASAASASPPSSSPPSSSSSAFLATTSANTRFLYPSAAVVQHQITEPTIRSNSPHGWPHNSINNINNNFGSSSMVLPSPIRILSSGSDSILTPVSQRTLPLQQQSTSPTNDANILLSHSLQQISASYQNHLQHLGQNGGSSNNSSPNASANLRDATEALSMRLKEVGMENVALKRQLHDLVAGREAQSSDVGNLKQRLQAQVSANEELTSELAKSVNNESRCLEEIVRLKAQLDGTKELKEKCETVNAEREQLLKQLHSDSEQNKGIRSELAALKQEISVLTDDRDDWKTKYEQLEAATAQRKQEEEMESMFAKQIEQQLVITKGENANMQMVITDLTMQLNAGEERRMHLEAASALGATDLASSAGSMQQAIKHMQDLMAASNGKIHALEGANIKLEQTNRDLGNELRTLKETEQTNQRLLDGANNSINELTRELENRTRTLQAELAVAESSRDEALVKIAQLEASTSIIKGDELAVETLATTITEPLSPTSLFIDKIEKSSHLESVISQQVNDATDLLKSLGSLSGRMHAVQAIESCSSMQGSSMTAGLIRERDLLVNRAAEMIEVNARLAAQLAEIRQLGLWSAASIRTKLHDIQQQSDRDQMTIAMLSKELLATKAELDAANAALHKVEEELRPMQQAHALLQRELKTVREKALTDEVDYLRALAQEKEKVLTKEYALQQQFQRNQQLEQQLEASKREKT